MLNRVGSLVQVTAGTLIFRGDGTHHGSFAVNGGTLRFEGTQAFESGASLGTASGATVRFEGTHTVNGPITMTGLGAVGIHSGTFTAGATVTATALTLAGGTLHGLSHLATANLTLAGGTIGSSGTLYAAGNNVVAGSPTIASGVTLSNPTGGTLTLQSGTINGPGTLSNSGTVLRTAAGSFAFSNVVLRNEAGGVFDVQAGSVAMGAGGGAHTGNFNTASGTTLGFGGSHAFDTGTTFTGPGTFQFETGTATFNADVSIPNLRLFGGTLAGTGALTVANARFDGGTLARHLTLTTGGTHQVLTGTTTINPSFVLANPAGATLDIQAGGFAGDGTLENLGTLIKTTAATNPTVGAVLQNKAGGVVDVQAGTLGLTGGGTHAGNFHTAPSTVLNFAGTHVFNAGATFTGLGDFRITGGTFDAAADLSIPNLTLAGGTLAGAGVPTVGNLTVAANSTLARNLTLTPGGSNRFVSGSVSLSGGVTLTNPTGSTIELLGTTGTGGLGRLANHGTITKTGTTTGSFGSRADNASGGVIDVQAGNLWLTGGGVHAGNFNTAASTIIYFGGTHDFGAGTSFTGAGRIRLDFGTHTFASDPNLPLLSLSSATVWSASGLTVGSLNIVNSSTLNTDLTLGAGTHTAFANSTLTINGGHTVANSAGSTLGTFSGNNTLAGAGTFLNSGTLTRTVTGTTTVSARLDNLVGSTVNVGAGTISLNGGGTHSGTFAVSPGATLRFGGGSHSLTADAGITGAGAVVVDSGTVTIVGDGTAHSGATTVNGGTLAVTGAGAGIGAGGVTVNSGGVLRLESAANLIGGTKALVSAGGVLALGAFDPAPVLDPSSAGILGVETAGYALPLDLSTLGGGQMFLGSTGTGSYTATTLGAGAGNAYRLGGAGGTLTLTGTNNVLTGGNSLIVGSTGPNGAGTVVLTNANNFTGGTTLVAGTLEIGNAGALGTGTLTLQGGALAARGGPVTLTNPVVLGGDARFTGTQKVTLSGNTNLAAVRNVTVDPGASAELSGQITGTGGLVKLGSGTLTVRSPANPFNWSNYSGGTVVAGGMLIAAGTGQSLGLGGVTVQTGAVLQQQAFGNVGPAASVHVQTGGVLSLAGNFGPKLTSTSQGVLAIDTPNYTIALNMKTVGDGTLFLGSVGSGTYAATTLAASDGIYRLGGGGGTLTISGLNVLTGSASLVIGNAGAGGSPVPNGAGTVVLANNQDFIGNTEIRSGSRLILNGNLTGGGVVFVQPGGTLGGTGTVAAVVAVDEDGVMDPGNSPGELTFAQGLFLNARAVVNWELASETTSGPGTDWDRLSVTGGDLSVDPQAVLNLSFLNDAAPDAGAFWASDRVWQDIIRLSGGATNSSGGGTFSIDNSPWAQWGAFSTAVNASGGVDLIWTVPIPEPSPWPVLAAAVGAVAVFTRRRHR